MTPTAILFLVALTAELVLLVVTVLNAIKERSSLARFVRAAADPERLKDVAMQLPGAYRAPATQFAGELARKGPLDEIVSQAVTKTANTAFGLEPMQRMLFGLGMALIVFVPVSASMIIAAISIDNAHEAAKQLPASVVFIEAKGAIDPAFGELHWAFQSSAALLAGMIVVACVHWWLARPEVREARFVKALLEAAIGARPGAPAPVTGRLTQLLAPSRSLGPPIAAFAFFCVALVGGWLFLMLTSRVKEANAADVYNAWPKDAEQKVSGLPGLEWPRLTGGGTPLRKVATLQIGPTEVDLSNNVWVKALGPNYSLSDKFPLDTENIDKALAIFKHHSSEMDVNALVHHEVPMSTVLKLLGTMHDKYGVRRSFCVFSREIPAPAETKGEPSRIPAGVNLFLTPPDTQKVSLQVEVDRDAVLVSDPGSADITTIDRTEPGWKMRLASLVRKRTPMPKHDEAPAWIAVRVKSGAMTYEQFTEALAAADTTCPTERDCGVPGVGFRFFLDVK